MKLAVFFLALTFLAACTNTTEKELKDREMYLSQKEYELLLKEQLIDMREQRMIKAGVDPKMLYSTDTAFVNKELTGLWSVEQTCINSDCQSSVLGDRKTEQWEIFYKEDVLIAKAMENEKLVRYYAGYYSDRLSELTYNRKVGTAEYPAAKMIVTLKQMGPSRLEGQREIHRNGCIIIYSLLLIKQ